MKTYTVLLMYPDYLAEPHYGEETWLWVGEAHNAGQALARAQCDARDNNGESEAEDFAHVITFEGECLDVARHGCIYEDPPPRRMVIEDLMSEEDTFEQDVRQLFADYIKRGGRYPGALPLPAPDELTPVWFTDDDPIERAYRSTLE